MNTGSEGQLVAEIAKFLEGREEFSKDHVAFIMEDVGSTDAETEKARFAQAGLAVVVATDSFTRVSDSGGEMTGPLELTICVFERPKLNRKNRGAMTGATANELLRSLLHLHLFEGLGRMRFASYVRYEVDEYYVWESRWRVELGADEATWGTGESAFGVVRTRRIRRAGTVVTEPDGNGDAFLLGVRDRHLEIDLTCWSNGEPPPDIGETFSVPVNGVETVFECTESDDTASSEEGLTIHIAGSTFPKKQRD